MKIGCSYNVFDSEELLEESITCIRKYVDYISVVYQTVSNFGESASSELIPLLFSLKDRGLIDELYEYPPKIEKGGHYNELNKRNIGLLLSESAGCTHHMAMDADEFYLDKDFEYLIEKVKSENLDSTYCQMRTYYKSSEYQLDPPEDYYVSLLYKIRPDIRFEFNKGCPVLVDPTRRMDSGKFYIFKRNELEMHHMSYVRNDIRKKLNNSSASTNFKQDIDTIVNHYNNWKYPDKVLWGGLPSRLLTVKKVEKIFNV